MVVDEEKGEVVGDIPDTKGVHGIAIAKDLGKGFTSNGQANTVTVFDLSTLKATATINVTGQNPDSILYDASTKRIWTFNGRTANATVIDATAGTVVGTVALAGKPETPVLDGKGSIFLNIEDKNSLVEIDAKSLAVKHTYPLEGCEAPSGIAMDTATRRVFSGCSDSKKLAVTVARTAASWLPHRQSARTPTRVPSTRRQNWHLPRRSAQRCSRGFSGQVQRGRGKDGVWRAHHGAGSQDASCVSGDRGSQAASAEDR